MTCEQSKEIFVLALYNELKESERQAFEAHLSGCAGCRQEFAEMQEALSLMNQRKREEPTAGEWLDSWENIRRAIETPELQTKPQDEPQREQQIVPQRVIRWRPASMPSWAYGIAAMLLIAVGIYAGRTWFSGHQQTSDQSSQQQLAAQPPSVAPPQDSTAEQTLAYLERSRNLLIGLTNLAEHQSLDLASHQRLSRTLIDQGNILAVSLKRPEQQRTRQLIQDLQIILMQLANIEVKPGVPVVELVKKGVDEKSILLKINVEAMRAAEQKSANKGPQEKKQSKRS
ncbi:MAG TPA: zf-HC2 domain-containing protein [Bacteroidota bacterium]|nr:zf-HC2 domain-containing protein [Bacteroidota bacterium]